MKTQLLKLCAVAVVGFGLVALPVQGATYINGAIAFTGGATLNGPINAATSYIDIFGPLGPGNGVPVVGGGASGSYATVPGGTPATFTPFAFNVPLGGPVQLWTFTVSGITYSFDITSVNVVLQNNNFLYLTGDGMAHKTGELSTAATWSIMDVGIAGGVTTFGHIAVVPEPSVTAFFAGLGAMLLIFRYRRQ